MNKKYCIGIDLGGTNLKIAVLNHNCGILSKEILPTQSFPHKEALIEALVSSVRNKLISQEFGNKISGIGVGVPGPVDYIKGVVHYFPNIPGWKEVPLKKILEKKLGLPVAIDNDANVMSLAEYYHGAARGLRHVLCVTLGTGVGGGLILNGTLYRGAENAAGEIGHLPLNLEGPSCNCGGKACVEVYVGNHRILARARRIYKKDITLEELSVRANKGDRRARDIWRNAGIQLGTVFAGAVNLLNLDAIVIGGGMANAGEVLFKSIRQTITSRAMQVQAKRVRICKAKLGSNAGIIGAAILAAEATQRF